MDALTGMTRTNGGGNSSNGAYCKFELGKEAKPTTIAGKEAPGLVGD